MKPTVKYALIGAAGITVFAGAFVIFVTLSGTPLREVPLIGRLVSGGRGDRTPDRVAAARGDTRRDSPRESGLPAPTGRAQSVEPNPKALDASIGVLGAFLMPAPYSTSELADLQQELRSALAEARARLGRVRARETELDEWERTLAERLADLQGLQKSIERSEQELQMREQEVARDERAKTERETKSWSEIARFFEEGDPEELAQKLVQFEAPEAARILRALDDARAGELVNALPAEKYHAYLEAYRAQTKP